MKLLVLILVIYLAYRVVKSWLVRSLRAGGQAESPTSRIDDVMVKDPVCGVYFPRRQGVELHQAGKTYLFCSTVCRDRFVAEKRK